MSFIRTRQSGYADDIMRLYGTFEGSNVGTKEGQRSCKVLTFQVTEDCNLNCSYCYQIHKTHNKMSFETARKLIDCIFDTPEKINKYFDIENLIAIVLEFIGGEPFLEIELIDKILDYYVYKAVLAKSNLAYNFKISISSNGTLYFTPKVQKFLSKWRDKLSLSISLDGCKELHDACRVFPDGSGSYDIVEKAVKHELSIDPNLATKMTLAPSNIDYFFEAIKNLVKLGYKEIFCNCVFEEGWSLQDAIKLYPYLVKTADYLLQFDNIPNVSFFDINIGRPLSPDNLDNWCGGTGKMLSFNYKGEFFPCTRYMESSLGTDILPYVIGNIDDGIMNTIDSCNKVNCLKCITRKSQSTSECFNCPVASGCAWCSAYNYQLFGTPNKRATFICDMHKVRVLGNCYFWNNYYRINNLPNRYKLYLDDESCLKIIDKEQLSLLRELESDN